MNPEPFKVMTKYVEEPHGSYIVVCAFQYSKVLNKDEMTVGFVIDPRCLPALKVEVDRLLKTATVRKLLDPVQRRKPSKTQFAKRRRRS